MAMFRKALFMVMLQQASAGFNATRSRYEAVAVDADALLQRNSRHSTEDLTSAEETKVEEICYDLRNACGRCSAWWWSNTYQAKVKAACCNCGGGVKHQPQQRDDQDMLTVMTFNTYLLRVMVGIPIDTRPNLGVRSQGINTWFRTLPESEVPDALVLEEIYSDEGEELMRALCSDRWRRNSNMLSHPHQDHIVCDQPDSPFGHATPNANPTHSSNPVKSSGTCVLLKKGNAVLSAEDQAFSDCKGEECFTNLGFWAVEFYKGTQKYWFYGTHATAWETEDLREIRHKQFQQLRGYIDEKVQDGERVAIAGDMNIFIAPFVTKEDGIYVRHTPEESGRNELERMMASLGSQSSPATAGTLHEEGFWLPLDTGLNASADPARNHFLANIESEVKLGSQRYDWVIAPGPGDRLATPAAMRYQVVPVKSDNCYVSEQPGAKGQLADDLADHYAVFAELKWTASAPSVGTLQGTHRGHGSSFPSGPSCTSP